MKKVLLKLSALALLLTCSVGMWAQTPGTTVRFKNADTGLYLQANFSGNATINTLDESSAAQKFILEDAGDGKYYLKSTANSQVVYLNQNSWNVKATTSTGDSNKMGIISLGEGKYSISTTYGTNTYFGTDGATDGSEVYSNKSVDNHGKWIIEELTVDITYEYTYNNEVMCTETLKAGESDMSLPTPTLNMFGVKYDAPFGAVSDGTTVQIPISYNFPFAIADRYTNVNAWYTLANNSQKYLLKYEEEQTSIALNETEMPETDTDAYMWAFVGDPFNGFEIVNKAAGSNKVLSNKNSTYDGNTGGNTFPLLKDKSSLSIGTGENNDVCKYFLTEGAFSGGFYIGYTDYQNKYVRMNKRGDVLAYWNGGADAGSTFTVTLAESSNLRDITYIYKYNGTKVGEEKLPALVGEAYPIPNPPYGYAVSGGLPSGTVTTTETINIDVENSLPFEYADSYANITKWYDIEFHSNKHRYMYYSDGIKFTTSNDGTNVNYMWAFVGNPIDGFQIYNKAAGSSVALDSYDPCGMSAAGTTCKWKVYPSSETAAGFCIKVDDQQYVNLQGQDDSNNPNGGDLSRWNAADAGSTAQVIEVPAATVALLDIVNARAFQAVAPRATLRADGTQLLTQETTGNDASSDELFAIIKSDKGNYYLYNIATEKFVTYTGINVADVALVDNDMQSMVVTTDGKTTANPYRFKFQGYYLNINGSKQVVINTWGNRAGEADDGNSFKFIDNGTYNLSDAIAAVNYYESPIAKTLTDYGYATLFTDHAVAIPEGATAYYVTVDGTTATLNEIEDVIPANTGVVVKGDANAACQFTYTTATATTDVSDNQMVGYLVDTPITGSAATSYYAVNYKTVGGEPVPGFFAPKGAGTPTGSFTAVGGKAYLKVEGAAGSSIVMRFGDATMVENLLKTQDAAIYDLTGRKVAQPERGIYIVNGKKMFFK